MSFDEVSFPLAVRFGAKGGPQFATEIISIQGGYERRNQRWSQARRRYDARLGVTSSKDASLLLAFFHARCGRARGFRLKDWSDYSSAVDGVSSPTYQDQAIGAGDGVQTIFQLIKTYGSGQITHIREIKKPVGASVRIGVNGLEHLTGWSVDSVTGLVTFAQPPALGAAITAGFHFDAPVRFDTDHLDITADDRNLACSEIPLIEVRV